MNKVTVEKAIAAIQNKFFGLAKIHHIEEEEILDIIFSDTLTGKWYEVYSNPEYTALKIELIN